MATKLRRRRIFSVLCVVPPPFLGVVFAREVRALDDEQDRPSPQQTTNNDNKTKTTPKTKHRTKPTSQKQTLDSKHTWEIHVSTQPPPIWLGYNDHSGRRRKRCVGPTRRPEQHQQVCSFERKIARGQRRKRSSQGMYFRNMHTIFVVFSMKGLVWVLEWF